MNQSGIVDRIRREYIVDVGNQVFWSFLKSPTSSEPMMRLTTKGRFAVTAMIDLALRQHQGPVTLAGISQRQKISLSYLEQLTNNYNNTHNGNINNRQSPPRHAHIINTAIS